MKVIWSDRALRQLEQIKRVVEEHFASRSEAMLEAIVLSPERRLIDFPRSGRPVLEEGCEGCRELVLERHLLVYRVQGEMIEIAGVHWQEEDRDRFLLDLAEDGVDS